MADDLGTNVEAMTTDHLIDAFIAANRLKAELEADLKPVKKDIEQFGAAIVERFSETGTQRISRNGATVHLSRSLSVKAKGGDTAAVVEALQAAGMDDLLGVNSPRIKSWCQERFYRDDFDTWEIDLDKLPKEIRSVVECSEYVQAKCRKG